MLTLSRIAATGFTAVAVLAALAQQGPQAVIDGLIYEVDQFCGGRRGHDDITLVVIRATG